MILIAHGGAGSKRPSQRALKNIRDVLSYGFALLQKGSAALDVVVETISSLEDSGIFNAGIGGNLQFDGKRRLDASVMEGAGLGTGSVIGVEGIKNPIRAARLLMDLPNTTLTETGANRIALAEGLEKMPPPDRESIRRLEEWRKTEKNVSELYARYFSTVGAVALDESGNVAAGASTGGIRGMLPGRVGDTPIIGAGIYAENNLGAVSCTGIGESIIRLSLAKEICMSMERKSPVKAAGFSLGRIIRISGQAGVIVIGRTGKFALVHTTRYMASGYVDKKGIVCGEAFNRITG